MKTDTRQKIFNFIQQNSPVTPKDIIEYISLGAPAVFRQLKKLQDDKLIYKSGKPPRVYYHIYMHSQEQQQKEVLNWASFPVEKIPPAGEYYCETRDVFQARSEKILKLLIDRTQNEGLSYLLLAIIGEIGNNSFDHNFGNWNDLPGVYFRADIEAGYIYLADRGQGILKTLQKANTDIKTEQEAVRIAFTKILSGRAPEKRGNGLKFVKKVIEDNSLAFTCYTGNTTCVITANTFDITSSEIYFPGTVSIITF